MDTLLAEQMITDTGLGVVLKFLTTPVNRLANRPRMAGIVPELTHGVPCPGRGSFCPGNVKIDHRLGYMAVH